MLIMDIYVCSNSIKKNMPHKHQIQNCGELQGGRWMGLEEEVTEFLQMYSVR